MAIACIPCAATAAQTLITSLGGVLTTGAATLAGAVGIKKISNRNKTKKKKRKKDKKKKKKKNQSGGRTMRRRTNKKSFKSRQRGGKSNKSLRRSFSRVYIEHI
jgi:hypothetical protein